MACNYEIGATLEGMTDLEELTTPLVAPSPDFEMYPVENQLPSGKVRGAGLPTADWHWDYLTFAQWAQLKSFCTGKSASVYIRTLKLGTTIDFATFQAVMVWPVGEDISDLVVKDVNIHFQAMVEVTP